jgi:NADH-quinone oxidoreductase subunit I
MLGGLIGLLTTFKELFLKPVTVMYPKEHMPVPPRWMGLPALTWDDEVGEPFCTGCALCMRNCPTQCIKVTAKNNPNFEQGKSTRRRIVDAYEINWARCIVCGICIQVCNFDANVMSHEHERSVKTRDGNKQALAQLIDVGKKYQKATGWTRKRTKSAVPPPKPPATPKAETPKEGTA